MTIGFIYPGVYYNTVGFGFTANGIPLLSNPTRNKVTLLQRTQVSIGAFDARGQGLGGWSLDVQHVYDPIGRTLYTGDGGRRRVESLNRVIETTAGTGAQGNSGDGGQATQAAFRFPQDVEFAPDGSVYVADNGNRIVRRIAPNGIVTRVAGSAGVTCSPATAPCGDGGPALSAQLAAPVAVAYAPDGSYYILDPGANRVRRVAPNGIITTVAGTGQVCPAATNPCGDGGPATQAQLNASQGLTVAADGTLYLADSSNRRIRRVGTDGIISTIAGNGNAGGCPVDGVPARDACLGTVFGVVAAPDGSVIFSESQFNRIFRVATDGIIKIIAGAGNCSGIGGVGDGGPATAAELCTPQGISRGADGSIYVTDWFTGRIRRIDPAGIISSVAGTTPGFSGDGGTATSAQINRSTNVDIAQDGSIRIADVNNQRIRRVNPPLPGFSNTDIAIPSPDGNELYQFNGEGRHLRTKNTLTGATKYTFNYDGAGRLTSVVDGDNNTTTIQRDGSGNPTGILSPDNQNTTFGRTATLSNPADPLSLVTRNVQNGTVTGTALANVTDTRGYNGFGELTSYGASFNASPLYSLSYTRDKLGRVTQKVETIGGAPSTYEYIYDLAGRLQEVKLNAATISSYTYDSNSNRLTRTTSGGTINATYDNQDRLLTYGMATYVYAANGELSNKTIGAQTTTYSYDALGNLRNAVLPDSTQLEYVIDGLNRRVGKRVNSALTQGFLYQDQFRPVAELDGSNNLVSRFVYGNRFNTPEYMIKNGVTYRFITDHLGSVRLVVNVATGAISQRMDYDEFGAVTMDTNPGFQPFGFAGGLYDAQTKLVRFGTRDYDAETGRWTAKDLILFAGEDLNLYGYVQSDPVNAIDVTGFIKWTDLVPGPSAANPINDLDNLQIWQLPGVIERLTQQVISIRERIKELLKCKNRNPAQELELKALEQLNRLLTDQIKSLKQHANNLGSQYGQTPYANPNAPITTTRP